MLNSNYKTGRTYQEFGVSSFWTARPGHSHVIGGPEGAPSDVYENNLRIELRPTHGDAVYGQTKCLENSLVRVLLKLSKYVDKFMFQMWDACLETYTVS